MKMKKIISGEKLYQVMQEAIDKLCNPIIKTLGPIGSNVIIDHSDFSPFITNDGVTIAKNIESANPVINTILELTKEASIKTDERVGDGTTTTLLLLKNFFTAGLKEIRKGKKPLLLKNEMLEALHKYLQALDTYKRKITSNELLNIAISSANDEEIGFNVYKVIKKIKYKQSIFLTDSTSEQTKITFYKGYQIETNLASPYFINNNEQISLTDVLILIADKIFNTVEEISYAINESITQNRPLVIIAEDYSEILINDIISLNFENKTNIILLKNPEYGRNKLNILNDLSIISNCQVLKSTTDISHLHIGTINHLTIDLNKTIFSFTMNNQIKKYVHKLSSEIEKDDDIYIKKTISMLTTGLAEISIGGLSKSDIREKHMRYEDAVNASLIALNGITHGSGLTLLQIKEQNPPETDGEKVIWQSLDKPFQQIITNAGLNYSDIYDKIKNNNYQYLYNIKNNTFELIAETSVIDPIEVVRESLKNATITASLLLTTEFLIINEYKNNIITNLDNEL